MSAAIIQAVRRGVHPVRICEAFDIAPAYLYTIICAHAGVRKQGRVLGSGEQWRAYFEGRSLGL